jgi:methylmalonyl-CoA/ethylmalonyl-CoA epimerase
MASLKDYIIGLRHVGIVTDDLAATVARFSQLFDLTASDIALVPAGDEICDTRFAFFEVAGTPYEVIEPVSDYFKDILLKTNIGTNHVCYNVSDLDAVVNIMAVKNVRLGHVTPSGIVDLPSFKMAYFNPEDTAGVLIEMVQQK